MKDTSGIWVLWRLTFQQLVGFSQYRLRPLIFQIARTLSALRFPNLFDSQGTTHPLVFVTETLASVANVCSNRKTAKTNYVLSTNPKEHYKIIGEQCESRKLKWETHYIYTHDFSDLIFWGGNTRLGCQSALLSKVEKSPVCRRIVRWIAWGFMNIRPRHVRPLEREQRPTLLSLSLDSIKRLPQD